MLSPRLLSSTRCRLHPTSSGRYIHNLDTSLRHRSIQPPKPINPQHAIYLSKSTNPYFNLSLEDWFVFDTPLSLETQNFDWHPLLSYLCLPKLSSPQRLFRHKAPDEPLLLLYRDDPCVVIGRNQNPWKEVNLPALRVREGVPFIRRRSGGGTVYHVRCLRVISHILVKPSTTSAEYIVGFVQCSFPFRWFLRCRI